RARRASANIRAVGTADRSESLASAQLGLIDRSHAHRWRSHGDHWTSNSRRDISSIPPAGNPPGDARELPRSLADPGLLSGGLYVYLSNRTARTRRTLRRVPETGCRSHRNKYGLGLRAQGL